VIAIRSGAPRALRESGVKGDRIGLGEDEQEEFAVDNEEVRELLALEEELFCGEREFAPGG
jgi:hypothetical protein